MYFMIIIIEDSLSTYLIISSLQRLSRYFDNATFDDLGIERKLSIRTKCYIIQFTLVLELFRFLQNDDGVTYAIFSNLFTNLIIKIIHTFLSENLLHNYICMKLETTQLL